MDHVTALNLILANECNNPAPGDPTLLEFNLEGHCTNYIIHARLASTMGTIQYDIVSVQVLD